MNIEWKKTFFYPRERRDWRGNNAHIWASVIKWGLPTLNTQTPLCFLDRPPGLGGLRQMRASWRLCDLHRFLTRAGSRLNSHRCQQRPGPDLAVDLKTLPCHLVANWREQGTRHHNACPSERVLSWGSAISLRLLNWNLPKVAARPACLP